jgi:hypothetical protein
MPVKKVTFEDVARAAFHDDRFNGDISLLDIMHVFEIAVKNLGLGLLSERVIDIDLGNGQAIRCKLALGGGKASDTNAMLELCQLAEPHLLDGQLLFASKSIVVGINDSQPPAERLADIDITIGQLKALYNYLEKKVFKP